MNEDMARSIKYVLNPPTQKGEIGGDLASVNEYVAHARICATELRRALRHIEHVGRILQDLPRVG